MGVNIEQARILVHGKITHLGYHSTEEGAARTYDRVNLALDTARSTNFPLASYTAVEVNQLRHLDRASLQTALGVKPMQKTSR
jgi:hypothetical protein